MLIEEMIEKIVVTMNTLVNTVEEMEQRMDKIEVILKSLLNSKE
mgnify:FL=1|tara:strand:- start:7822 stop:7953 length:132 start_codon:yes stop_codon:yes gene_type:complete